MAATPPLPTATVSRRRGRGGRRARDSHRTSARFPAHSRVAGPGPSLAVIPQQSARIRRPAARIPPAIFLLDVRRAAAVLEVIDSVDAHGFVLNTTKIDPALAEMVDRRAARRTGSRVRKCVPSGRSRSTPRNSRSEEGGWETRGPRCTASGLPHIRAIRTAGTPIPDATPVRQCAPHPWTTATRPADRWHWRARGCRVRQACHDRNTHLPSKRRPRQSWSRWSRVHIPHSTPGIQCQEMVEEPPVPGRIRGPSPCGASQRNRRAIRVRSAALSRESVSALSADHIAGRGQTRIPRCWPGTSRACCRAPTRCGRPLRGGSRQMPAVRARRGPLRPSSRSRRPYSPLAITPSPAPASTRGHATRADEIAHQAGRANLARSFTRAAVQWPTLC